MEVIWVGGIILWIVLLTLSIGCVVKISRYTKLHLEYVLLILLALGNICYFFLPDLLTVTGYITELSSPKIDQLQNTFPNATIMILQSEKHNAAILAPWWRKPTIIYTSKTIEQTSIEELLWVTYHEIWHTKDRSSLWKMVAWSLLYYFGILLCLKIKKRWLRFLFCLAACILLVIIYLWLCRQFERSADAYAKNEWYGDGLAMYFERAIADSESWKSDWSGVNGIRYLHPPLEERIKFLRD